MRIFLLILLFGLTLSCKTQSPQEKAEKNAYFSFGSGGGFTGAITTYTLHRDGRLTRGESLAKTTTTLAPLPAKKARGFFRAYAKGHLKDSIASHPGNITFFIELHEGGNFWKHAWGDGTHPAPKEVQELYDKLMECAEKSAHPAMNKK